MIPTKRISGIAAIVVIATILLIPYGMTSITAIHVGSATDPHNHFVDLTLPDDPNYKEDTIGDVKIRANFGFRGLGSETVDSFRIFNQLGGYSENSNISFQLLGGVGGDKTKLYTTTDMTHASNFDQNNEFADFDVDVYLFHRGDEIAFRHFMYINCDVVDYQVATLHDGDETFSGITKFVLADAFTFSCMGFHPHSPSAIAMLEGDHSRDPSKSISSLDLIEQQHWTEVYKYHN